MHTEIFSKTVDFLLYMAVWNITKTMYVSVYFGYRSKPRCVGVCVCVCDFDELFHLLSFENISFNDQLYWRFSE